MKLLRTLILRPLRRDLLRTALTILSVALGVAVVVAIDLAGDAATGSFRSSMQTLAGKTDLEIFANGGLDERLIAPLAALPYDAHFAPIIEAQACSPASAPCRSTAPISPARPKASPSPKPLADRLTPVPSPSTSPAVRCHLPNRADHSPPRANSSCSISPTRSSALHRYGKLDRIDVTLGPGEDLAKRRSRHPRARCRLRDLIEKPGARSEENQRMLRAFRWNLRVLSYISLVVGAFLIYNTISVSVVRRRAEIGILRAIGAARATVLALFLAEALLFGVIGAALGVCPRAPPGRRRGAT